MTAVAGRKNKRLPDSPERPEALLRQAVRANIRASANQLRHGSQVIERLIRKPRAAGNRPAVDPPSSKDDGREPRGGRNPGGPANPIQIRPGTRRASAVPSTP